MSRRPRRVGDGPSASTSNHAIERQPFRWDTNRFYARLGLTPEASRVEIARSFIEHGGHGSSAMTTAITLLLNKQSRRFYDALIIGSFWGGDEALQHHRLDPGASEFQMGQPEWSVYADHDVSDDEAHSLSPDWRTRIGFLLWRSGVSVRFSLGVTNGDPRLEVIGYEIVIFLPLAVKPEWEYAATIAEHMLSMLNANQSTSVS